MKGYCIVRKCRCQIGWVQCLDIWQTHTGLIGQHPEGKQTQAEKLLLCVCPQASAHFNGIAIFIFEITQILKYSNVGTNDKKTF